MLALLFLVLALVCFAIEVVAEVDTDLIALGLALLTLAMILNHKRFAGRVP